MGNLIFEPAQYLGYGRSSTPGKFTIHPQRRYHCLSELARCAPFAFKHRLSTEA